jgi:predicted HicB family RNase H-like nuclease
MSLDRKDLRIKLDPDDHTGLQLLADAEDQDMSAWAEALLKREIRRRVHAAIVLAARAQRLGIAGSALPAER